MVHYSKEGLLTPIELLKGDFYEKIQMAYCGDFRPDYNYRSRFKRISKISPFDDER
jgi:hypothetical protein